MHLPFSLFLALKYLKPKRSFISVITVISIVGVAIGVAVLVIVLSVMTGFDDMWREKILGFNAHLTVAGPGILTEEGVKADVRKVLGVVGAAPRIQSPVVLQHRSRIATPLLIGVSPEDEGEVSVVPRNVKQGSFDVHGDHVVVGRDLAGQLGLRVGEKVLISSPQSFLSRDEIALPKELKVSGIFSVGLWEYDLNFMFCSIETALDLLGEEGGCHEIKVMTSEPYRAAETADKIRDAIGPAYEVRTWMDMNRQLFDVLRVEKNMMFFLLVFITVVAAFGITNTLITVAVQKTREIGLLRAIGFSTGKIMRVFFWQGCIAGVVGAVGGVGLGLLVLRYRNHILRWMAATLHMELFPKQMYQFSEIPATVSWLDICVVAVLAVAICTLAGLIPARQAARLDPAQALRRE